MADFENPLARKDFEDYLASIGPSSDAQPVQVASAAPMSASVPAPVRAQPAPTAAPAAPPAAAEAPNSIRDNVQAAIAKKYGFAPGLDSDALNAATDQANKNNLYANLSGIGSNLATAISGSNQKGDESVTNSLKANADAPITKVLAGRKAAVEDDAMKEKQEDNDPNSVKATILRRQLAPLATKVGLDPADFNSLSADDLKKFAEGPLQFAAKLQEQGNIAKDRRIAAQGAAQDREASRRDAKEAKDSMKQHEAFRDLMQKAQTARGNPAVQQAEKNILSADNATEYIENTRRAGRPITTQDLRVLADETAKMATGGVPGEHGTEALLPNNLKTKIAEMQNFLSSKPTDADATAYVDHNLNYIKDLRNVADKTVKQYYRRVGLGYRDLVSPQNYKEFENEFLGSGQSQPSGSISTPPPHPQDSQAVQWAKQNPNDPRAAKILQVNGAQNAGL